MRRITTWLAVTLSVIGFATYYQVALAGDGHGQTDRQAVSEECSGTQAPRAPQAETAETPAPAEADKAEDPCAQSEHTGKPGEQPKD